MEIKYKLNLITSEESQAFEGLGKFKNDIISFIYDGFEMSLDTKNNIFTREGKDLLIRYEFDIKESKQCKILMKEMQQEMNLEVKTHEITKTKNKYYVSFEIVDNEKIEIDIDYMEV